MRDLEKLFYYVENLQTSIKGGPNEFCRLIDRLILRLYDKK